MVEGEQYFKNTDFNIEKVTIKYNPDNPKENIYLFQIYTEMIAGIVGIAICIVSSCIVLKRRGLLEYSSHKKLLADSYP